MSRPEILDIQPGYLNDFNADDVDQESIDFQSESPQSQMTRMRDKVYSPNKFKTSGTLIGILLRADNRYSGDCTPQDDAIQGATGADAKYRLNTYKVRVPEIHFMLPVPNNLNPKFQSKEDKLAIDCYPTIQALDTLVQNQGARPGDLVKVELANKGAITRMYFAGPLDPKTANANVQALKDCIDECRKRYTGQASVGDCMGKNKNVSKLDEIRPVATGEGNQEKKAINVSSPNWLKDILDKNGDGKGTDSPFDGVTIFGRLATGASDDDIKMIDGAGRSTVIFIPKGVDVKKNVELIYFFHDKNKFSKDKKEWEKIAKTMFSMTRKSDKLDGARRNIIFIMPEMLWSKQASPAGSDYPRVNSSKGATLKNEYGDRQWAMWGFGGKLKNGYKDKTPLSYKSASPAPKGVGNVKTLIKTVHKKLKEHLGSDVKAKVKFITLAAMGHGGIAISNLARRNQLKEFGKELQKIQLFHADFGGHPDNHYHDSDIKDIMAAIDPKSTEVEFHLSSNGPESPTKAVASYIGQTSKLTVDWMTADPSKLDPDKMSEAHEALTKDYLANLKFSGDTKAVDSSYEKSHKSGMTFVDNNKTKTLKLSGPWSNFIFRGVSSGVDFDWITWLDDGKVPTSAAAGGFDPKSLVVVPGSNMSKEDQQHFSEFTGKILLYNSKHAGLSGKTAIVVPLGADLSKKYELIYFFHGLSAGKESAPDRWKTDGFSKKVTDQLHNMVTIQKRNVVYVTMQLNLKSKIGSDKATFGNNKNFEEFHKEIVGIIKETDLTKGLGGDKGDPKFINFKSFSGGYYSVEGIINKMSSQNIGGSVPLQRIDYLDSTYSYKNVFKKIFKEKKLSGAKPGENFEVHVYGSTKGNKGTWDQIKKLKSSSPCKNSKFNGCAKIMDGNKEAELSQLEGLYLEWVSGGHSGPLKKRLSKKSLLASPGPAVADPSFKPVSAADPTKKVNPKNIPVSYDAEGNAYNSDGDILPDKYSLSDPNIKCEKGNKKKQTAKTYLQKKYNACVKACRKRFSGKQGQSSSGFDEGTPSCTGKNKNPLGLKNFGAKSDFNKKLKITHSFRNNNKGWGKAIVEEFILNILESEIWTHPSLNPTNGGSYSSAPGKPKVQWFIEDISTKWANGIDKIGGHASHRAGYDIDLNLPIDYRRSKPGTKLKYGFQKLYDGSTKNQAGPIIDYDKCIALGLMILQTAGMSKSRVYVGVSKKGAKFCNGIRKRAQEIFQGQNYDPNFIGPPPVGLDELFGTLRGNEDMLKRIKRLFAHEPNHQNHFHVRLGRKVPRSFKALQAILKKNKCAWKGPHPRSPQSWREYAQPYADQGQLPEKRNEPK